MNLDHSVVAVTDWERSNAFYRDVLGAELIQRGAGWAYRFGDQQLNVHGPGSVGDPATSVPIRPEHSHMCWRWEGSIDDAIAHLRGHGVDIEVGPIARTGARGDGESVYFRDPDGTLLEFIAYG